MEGVIGSDTTTTPGGFNNINGANPLADASGNLFGTTVGGGANNQGTVFEIAKTAGGYASTPTTLVSFNGINGSFPAAALIADASGNLFGTTAGGGANSNDGTVFELTGSGFVPQFAGFPGTVNCFGQSVARLLQQYGTLEAAASALGFSDPDALKNAIFQYCGPSVRWTCPGLVERDWFNRRPFFRTEPGL